MNPTSSSISQQQHGQQTWPGLPCHDLFENNDDYIKICLPLRNASVKGDWKAAEVILQRRPELVRFSISENHDTALHIAASAEGTELTEKFVENLVNKMTREDLQLQNSGENTALWLAAAAGNVKIAMIMVKKNPTLLIIRGSGGMMPLYIASLLGRHEMVNYLYSISKKMADDFWTHENRLEVLLKCVEADFFDVALKIVTDQPELARDEAVLGVLAQKKDALRGIKPHFIWRFVDQILVAIHLKVAPAEKPTDAMLLLRTVWTNIVKFRKKDINHIITGLPDETEDETPTASEKERQETVQLLKTMSEKIANLPVILYDIIKGVSDDPLRHDKNAATSNAVKPKKDGSQLLFIAAEMGNTGFVVELIRQYPDLIWKTNYKDQTIFHVAVAHRHKGIYNLMQEIGSVKDVITRQIDKNGNNMLHLAGKSANTKRLQNVSGVALQMQRELLWFKHVQDMVPPSYREMKNNDGISPHDLFREEHKDLMSESEKWMKDTASQCMVVAALIATIVFGAAFTFPGGYDQNNGFPMLVHKRSLIVFVISDAISLTLSSVSILIFLSILTSRYAEDDFLELLPKRLIRGLATLFFSIAAMMVAFCVSFFVLYQTNLIWVPIVISIFASAPVIIYVRLQYHLLGDVYHSTYGSNSLFKQRKHKLYYENPKL